MWSALQVRPHSTGQTCRHHPLTILTKPAWHHNSYLGSRCDSNHAPTISLKPCTFSRQFRQFFSAYDTLLFKAHLITTSDQPQHFESFQPYFLNHHISANPYQSKSFQATKPKNIKNKPNSPADVFNYVNYDTQENQVSTSSLTKVLSFFSGRGLPA